MAQLTELKHEATTRRRAGAVVVAVTVAVLVGVTGWLAVTQLGGSETRSVGPAETPSTAAELPSRSAETPSRGNLDPGR